MPSSPASVWWPWIGVIKCIKSFFFSFRDLLKLQAVIGSAGLRVYQSLFSFSFWTKSWLLQGILAQEHRNIVISMFFFIVIIKVLTHLEHSIESHFLLQELVIGVSPVAERYVGTASCSFYYIVLHLNLLQKRSKPLAPSALPNIQLPLVSGQDWVQVNGQFQVGTGTEL